MSFNSAIANNGHQNPSSKLDESIMNGSTPTGLNGISILINSVEKGTIEVKNLLYNECDVILECKICRNLFRSVPNFIIHKRSYCRGSAVEQFQQQFLASNGNRSVSNDAGQSLDRPSSTESCPNLTSDANGGQSSSGLRNAPSGGHNGENRGNSLATKNTFNFLNRLTKRMEIISTEISRNSNNDVPLVPMHTLPSITKIVPFTMFENGVQLIKNPWILEKLPSKEADKNGIAYGTNNEDELVTMVVPQDAANRLHSMALRTRRHPDPSTAIKEIPVRDQALYQRLASRCAQVCDLISLQCITCKKMFKSLETLAFHLTCQHKTDDGAENTFCLLCDSESDNIRNHMNTIHKSTAIKYDEENSVRKKSGASSSNDLIESGLDKIGNSGAFMDILEKNQSNVAFISSMSVTATTRPRVFSNNAKNSTMVARKIKLASKFARHQSSKAVVPPSKQSASSGTKKKKLETNGILEEMPNLEIADLAPFAATDEQTGMNGDSDDLLDAPALSPRKIGDSDEKKTTKSATLAKLRSTRNSDEMGGKAAKVQTSKDSEKNGGATKSPVQTLRAGSKRKRTESMEAKLEKNNRPAPSPVAVRTMRKRTLKSPYDASEYVNTWPKRRVAASKVIKQEPPFSPEPLNEPNQEMDESPEAAEMNGSNAEKKITGKNKFAKSPAVKKQEITDGRDDEQSKKAKLPDQCYPVIFSEEQKAAIDKMVCRDTLTCLACGIAFSTIQNTERHCYGHLGFVRFKCIECGASAFHRTDLRRHLKNECKALKANVVTVADMNRFIVPICADKPGSVVAKEAMKEFKPKKKRNQNGDTSISSLGNDPTLTSTPTRKDERPEENDGGIPISDLVAPLPEDESSTLPATTKTTKKDSVKETPQANVACPFDGNARQKYDLLVQRLRKGNYAKSTSTPTKKERQEENEEAVPVSDLPLPEIGTSTSPATAKTTRKNSAKATQPANIGCPFDGKADQKRRRSLFHLSCELQRKVKYPTMKAANTKWLSEVSKTKPSDKPAIKKTRLSSPAPPSEKKNENTASSSKNESNTDSDCVASTSGAQDVKANGKNNEAWRKEDDCERERLIKLVRSMLELTRKTLKPGTQGKGNQAAGSDDKAGDDSGKETEKK